MNIFCSAEYIYRHAMTICTLLLIIYDPEAVAWLRL